MSGRFSLEQIAADLAAGSLISGVVVQRLNISPFRVKRGNSTLCSTLSTLSTRHGSSLSHGLLLYSFGKTVRETMAAIRLCSLRSSLVFSPLSPFRETLFRERGASIEEVERCAAISRTRFRDRSRKFRLIHARLAIFPGDKYSRRD